MTHPKRPIIIGNVAGAMEDCPHAMYEMVTGGHVDAIAGDWLSELNIAWNAIRKHDNPRMGYEVGFLEQLEGSIDIIAEKKIKLVSNAGALNTPECAAKVREICEKRDLGHLRIAYVEGDDISDIVGCVSPGVENRYLDSEKQAAIGGIVHLDHTTNLGSWSKTPYCGVAYFGAWGIVEALRNNADIVICGRVTDASPVIGLAAWWHDWTYDEWDKLAGALIAGHLIECGPYVTGANFSGLRANMNADLVDLGFPIAEIDDAGEAIITKHPGTAGYIDQMNVRAQFLYEIQGTIYINSDVTADIQNIHIANTDVKDRVRVWGATGSRPPSTTKAIVVAIGGYQAEATFYMNGLDLDTKEAFMRQQLLYAFKDTNIELSIERYGTAVANPKSQALGTVSVRVLAKAPTKEDLSEAIFRKRLYALRMQFYAGYHMSLDFRTMSPKMFMELFPGLISYTRLPHRVVLPDRTLEIHHHGVTGKSITKRPSANTANPSDLKTFGETKRVPLGAVAHARSGDKGDNCNIGFFCGGPSDSEYAWLKSFLTVEKMKALLGDDWRPSVTIERCEFPNIHAVHFRLLDFLGGGGSSSSRIDMLGKGVAEYLRSKFVDVPLEFLKDPISLV